MNEQFSKEAVFEYNKALKLRFAFLLFGLLFVLASLFATYFLFFHQSDLAFFNAIRAIVSHVKLHIGTGTLLGIFYVALIAGLFFVTIPLELAFIGFLRLGVHPFIIVALYLLGMAISFTINYFLGMELDTLSKKVITPKKFYKFKGILNKHGVLAVFAFNALPFFPSQPLSAILGVFRYNKTKFYLYFLLGQGFKYAIISIGYIYIFA